jgi:hypothetical protein
MIFVLHKKKQAFGTPKGIIQLYKEKTINN